MKLVIVGATGFVGPEVITQALQHPSVTEVMALARRTTPLPEALRYSLVAKKFKSVVLKDFSNYTEDVKQELSGLDACIW